MKVFFRYILFFTLILQSDRSWSAENRDGIWFGTFGRKPITDSVSFLSEVQLRYSTDLGSMSQTLFRGGLVKRLSVSHEAGFLMAYVQTNLLKEYRPTLQHSYATTSFFETQIMLRSRLEFRDLEDNPDSSLRYRLLVRSQTPIKSYLSFVFWDEPFFNLTKEDWTGARVFERNRFFTGLRWTHDTLNIEFGYLNQFVPRQIDVSEHLFVVYINY